MTALAKPVTAPVLAAYVRVSTERQKDKDTPAMQRAAIASWHAQHPEYGPDIVWYEDPGVSGGVPLAERPEGRRLLADAKAGEIGAIVCYADDRMHRDAADSMTVKKLLRRLKIPLYSTGQGRIGVNKLLDGITGIVAEAGKDDTSRRAQDGAHTKVLIVKRDTAGGVTHASWMGGVTPYAFKIVPHENAQPGVQLAGWLVIDETIAPVVRDIFRWAGDHGLSCPAIATRLNQQGVPTRYVQLGREYARGKRRHRTAGVWTPGAVRRILTNTIYRGDRLHGLRNPDAERQEREWERKPVACETPAIVHRELWNRAQVVLKRGAIFGRGRGGKRKDREPRDYLLRGMLRCGECGLTYCASLNPPNKGGLRYVCNGRAGWKATVFKATGQRKCTAAAVAYDLEGMIKRDVARLILDDPERIRRFAEQESRSLATVRPDVVSTLQAELAKLDRQDARVKTGYAEGVYTATDAKAERARIAIERAMAEKALAEAAHEEARATAARDRAKEIERLCGWVRERLQESKLDQAAWRAVLEAMIVKATVYTRRAKDGFKKPGPKRTITVPAYAMVVVEYAYGLERAFLPPFDGDGLAQPVVVPPALVAQMRKDARSYRGTLAPTEDGSDESRLAAAIHSTAAQTDRDSSPPPA